MAWSVLSYPPHFKVPLSAALLSDPAFSSDPRSHPHFNANPPTQPPRLKHRKATMKALVRRLTSHHNLDRIDELDETDPFGTNYHHNGPYEAIGTAQAEPTAPSRTTAHHSKRTFNPRSLHPTQHPSLPRVPSIHGEKGLSLHLKPGQVLQHNTIYTSRISTVASVPDHLPRQSNTPAIATQLDLSRSHSLPDTQIRFPENSPLRPLNDLHNRPSSHPHAPSQRYLGSNTPAISNILPLHHDHHAVPYVPSQTTKTVFPPPRRTSRLHNPSHSPPPQPTLLPSVSRETRSTGGTSLHDTEHQSVYSLDSSHTLSSINSRISPGVQSVSSEPPRARHLPKRLVMPAPLQPEPQYRFPLAEHAVWRDECSEDRISVGTDPESFRHPVVYNQGPRLLRKKSSAYPGELPIPHHVPMLQDDAALETGDIPIQMESEAEGTKEKKRRRRLSKRKSDIPPLTSPR